mmetsp:Transcript_12655/g.28933  ORF Transcript_12655/g.28933 Transcript_12655/m.28933 type:complete len:236 (+) Transcript_12655:295-1002(+)
MNANRPRVQSRMFSFLLWSACLATIWRTLIMVAMQKQRLSSLHWKGQNFSLHRLCMMRWTRSRSWQPTKRASKWWRSLRLRLESPRRRAPVSVWKTKEGLVLRFRSHLTRFSVSRAQQSQRTRSPSTMFTVALLKPSLRRIYCCSTIFMVAQQMQPHSTLQLLTTVRIRCGSTRYMELLPDCLKMQEPAPESTATQEDPCLSREEDGQVTPQTEVQTEEAMAPKQGGLWTLRSGG